MHFRTFIICALLISSTLAWGVGRKPAVEDFVGIEVDHPESTPQGTESLVNLEKDIQTIEAQAYTVKSPQKKPQIMESTESSWSVVNTMTVVMFMGLPLLSWLFIMNRLRKKASMESASNVEVLEKYRREREQSRKRDESERKVS